MSHMVTFVTRSNSYPTCVLGEEGGFLSLPTYYFLQYIPTNKIWEFHSGENIDFVTGYDVVNCIT
jgi:hypothetical protein